MSPVPNPPTAFSAFNVPRENVQINDTRTIWIQRLRQNVLIPPVQQQLCASPTAKLTVEQTEAIINWKDNRCFHQAISSRGCMHRPYGCSGTGVYTCGEWSGVDMSGFMGKHLRGGYMRRSASRGCLSQHASQSTLSYVKHCACDHIYGPFHFLHPSANTPIGSINGNDAFYY